MDEVVIRDGDGTLRTKFVPVVVWFASSNQRKTYSSRVSVRHNNTSPGDLSTFPVTTQ